MTDQEEAPTGPKAELATLSLAALGIVYGDIGTSPLYAIRECFFGGHAVAPTAANVLGVLSLIFWALTLIISVKYVAYVLRADNKGEGGILALMALASRRQGTEGMTPWLITMLGLFGAALLYGDGMITPAISVLSAIEGVGVAAPGFEHFVVPITLMILFALFAFQRRGTAGVGALFGPVTLVWFVVLGVLGVRQLVIHPHVLTAVNPLHAVSFLRDNALPGFLVLGAVFLVVTGGEALYADMGHFGVRPIRLTWFAVVLPALLLNYFGQGALLLSNPAATSNPFYRLAPEWALYPLIVLSTLATIIASQAVISGAFSLTRQATMLGFWPRVHIMHTSSREIGQIYVPSINWFLMLATMGLVIAFGTSANLAAAYGIAVTTTMVITTLLAYIVARRLWHWSITAAVAVTVLFLIPDMAFFGANIIKIEQGGWLPLAVAVALFAMMTTWKSGRQLLRDRMLERILPLADFYELMRIDRPARVPGTAVFMTGNPEGTPPALVHNVTHNRVLHEQVIMLTVVTEEEPWVDSRERVHIEPLEQGFLRVTARYGFMEEPNIPAALVEHIPELIIENTTFFLGRETLLAHGRGGMARWREALFAFMARNSQGPTAFFKIPPTRVMEIGAQIEL